MVWIGTWFRNCLHVYGLSFTIVWINTWDFCLLRREPLLKDIGSDPPRLAHDDLLVQALIQPQEMQAGGFPAPLSTVGEAPTIAGAGDRKLVPDSLYAQLPEVG